MVETVLLLLLLGTWSGIFWVYRRLAQDVARLSHERTEQTETQASLARMVAQLQEAADELAQAMSARTGRLHDLLAQADRRIETLQAATQTSEAAQQTQVPVQVQAEVGQMADAQTHGNAHNAGTPSDGSNAEILRLAAQGLSAHEIAQRTHRGREEIRLLLQLSSTTHHNPPQNTPLNGRTNGLADEGTTR